MNLRNLFAIGRSLSRGDPVWPSRLLVVLIVFALCFPAEAQQARKFPKQVNAIMTITTRTLFAERKWIVELAARYRLPAIYSQKEYVDAGGLMSYGTDFNDLYRRAAVYVDSQRSQTCRSSRTAGHEV